MLTKQDLKAIESLLDRKLDQRFDEFEKKLEEKLNKELDRRFEEFEKKIDKKIDTKLEVLYKLLSDRIDRLEERIVERFGDIESRLTKLESL